MMTISIDLDGCYFEHKEFFDAMAIAMQEAGHRVGIITGIREKVEDVRTGHVSDKRSELLGQIGFIPDFFHMWGQFETIASGSRWKVQKMIVEQVTMHFDDDATDLKKYTGGWVLKSLNSGDPKKF